MSSTGMRKGLSSSRRGVGMFFSTSSISFRIASLPSLGSPPEAAARADPLHDIQTNRET
jgi:hypothetical protein